MNAIQPRDTMNGDPVRHEPLGALVKMNTGTLRRPGDPGIRRSDILEAQAKGRTWLGAGATAGTGSSRRGLACVFVTVDYDGRLAAAAGRDPLRAGGGVVALYPTAKAASLLTPAWLCWSLRSKKPSHEIPRGMLWRAMKQDLFGLSIYLPPLKAQSMLLRRLIRMTAPLAELEALTRKKAGLLGDMRRALVHEVSQGRDARAALGTALGITDLEGPVAKSGGKVDAVSVRRGARP